MSSSAHDRGHSASSSPFLQLPGEILSQIASYLPITEIIPFLSLHPKLLRLTQSHLSPLPSLIKQNLLTGPPYPHVLSILPQLPSFIPDDGGRLFLDVLVRARPKWILERFEMGRWNEPLWQEAFERRFLRSWKSYRKDDDTWRAAFLRVLGRLEHRYLGCTHEESWTRWVTLHRNGSASVNRFYSRLFDPYDIYDELKNQNNFSSQPTQVRVLLHLQDIRILAIGVLYDQTSIFVNPNAHLLLHPPLLRNILPFDSHITSTRVFEQEHSMAINIPLRTPRITLAPGSESPRTQRAATSSSNNPNEAYFPLVRSLSPSSPATTSYGLGDHHTGLVPLPTPPTAGSSFRSALAGMMPGRHRRISNENTVSAEDARSMGNLLTRARSGDSDDGRRRSWGFGRTRSTSASIPLNPNVNPNAGGTGSPFQETPPRSGEVPLPQHLPSLQEVPSDQHIHFHPPTPPRTPPIPQHKRRPYQTLQHPLPAPSHQYYPNYTPYSPPILSDKKGPGDVDLMDRRPLHHEVEDDYRGSILNGDGQWPAERMSEYDAATGTNKRWVGPMIIVAQLHSATRPTANPYASNEGPTEGPNPDLGPKGMYVSLGQEDIESIMPWVELRGGGAHHTEAMRSGLGFE